MDSDLIMGTVPDDDDREVPQVKLKRVLMEFEDGTIECLEGEDAKTWQASLRSEIFMSWVHGRRMTALTWKQISKEDAASLFLK